MAKMKKNIKRTGAFFAGLIGAALSLFHLGGLSWAQDIRSTHTVNLSQTELVNLKLDLLINAFSRERVFSNEEIQALREIGSCSNNNFSQANQACVWSPATMQFLNAMPQQAVKIMPQQAVKIVPQQ